VEARLTDLLGEAPVHPGAGSRDPLAVQLTVDNEPPHNRLLARIDRYLRAAGAEEPSLRGRLMAATARDLLAKGLIAQADWAEIIAAIDRSLAEELASGGKTLPRARGRVALRLRGATAHGSAAISGPDWGTPPRRHEPMPPQDLARWRPTIDWLRRLQLSRPAQGLAAGLCWLAVLFVP
jgi:hypothetical protein